MPPSSAPGSPFHDEFYDDPVVQYALNPPESLATNSDATPSTEILFRKAFTSRARNDTFEFQNNRLAVIPSEISFSSLRNLSLPHCGLTAVPFERLPLELLHLNLRNNRLCGESLRNVITLRNLISLDIGNNYCNGRLPSLPSTLQHLESCFCECEHADTLANLLELRTLDLGNNQLCELPSLVLHRKLEILRVPRNRLTSLQLPDSLRHLDAEQNLLELVPKLPTRTLETVQLDGNPCACALLNPWDLANLSDDELRRKRKARLTLAETELAQIDKEMAARAVAAASPSMVCPICADGRPMQDPVVCADGHSYERKALLRWRRLGNVTSPKTGLPFEEETMVPNHALRESIVESVEREFKRTKTAA